jgi:pyrimidine operon attenuation protein/uracil phosphoribosyltransferase
VPFRPARAFNRRYHDRNPYLHSGPETNPSENQAHCLRDYENNFQEEEVVLAGIYDKGYLLAQILQRELTAIAPLRTRLVKISLEKFTPVQGEVALDCPTEALRHRSIVVVDDVLNTGRTLMHSLKPLLEIEVKKIQIAVMVDRSHRTFPVAAGYVGYSLSTYHPGAHRGSFGRR